MLSAEEYARERAICDRAETVMRELAPRVYKHGGAIPAEVVAHPDYAACDNAMRGRVEQYELTHNTPERFSAYVGDRIAGAQYILTTWTGDRIGTICLGSGWRVDSYVSTRMYQAHATVNGREFTGRTHGCGMLVNLRETAASKRKRAESK